MLIIIKNRSGSHNASMVTSFARYNFIAHVIKVTTGEGTIFCAKMANKSAISLITEACHQIWNI